MDKRELIAKEIKFARQKKGWTQKELAEHSGVSSHTVCSIEKQQRKAQIKIIFKLCQVLDIKGSKLKDLM
jgi:DNA-binding XRE family transcriptional regulator